MGQYNTAVGTAAMARSNGNNNTAVGAGALDNAMGEGNIAVGYRAGSAGVGSGNIDIGNAGVSADSGIIRIGTTGAQTVAYVAGIYNVPITGGLPVVVNSNGQLGVSGMSSERFKTDIQPMPATEDLERLQSVTFHYKSDPEGPVQYGLIAEEVADVYPDLVVRDESGRIDGIRYDELAPLLLKRMQAEQTVLQAQKAQIAALKRQLSELRASVPAR
jgi:hypothetical protein